MKTKHQPATPLPWTVEYPNLDDARITSRLQDVGEAKRNNDADYIAHAANAYPKLVGALRHLLDANCATCPTAEAITEARALARHVLREIGEAE